jgi:hypothetical protein
MVKKKKKKILNGEKKEKDNSPDMATTIPNFNTCVLVQISVPRYFFMVLNSELKGQEKKYKF